MRYRRWLPIVLLSFIFGMIAIPPANAATITVTDLSGADEPQDLADSLAGTGVTVSNVTFSGVDTSAGSFTGGASTVGFDAGVILSSGGTTNAVGPNDSDGTSQTNGTPGDADLDAIEAGTEDATVLEFDVTPDDDHLSFSYVFGSEEYNEFVDSFNDVFAFFIGAAKVNCAVVADGPDAGTDPDPVSINSINLTSNAALYRNNDPSDVGQPSIDIEADGLTVVLQCNAAVTANASNHFKLAIADRSDSALDSWVFIQAGSITTTPLEICDNGLDDDDDTLVDGDDPDCAVSGDTGVAGTKFYDVNANGVQDVGEPGIEDWVIDVTNGSTTSVATAADGSYSVALDPGTYDVSERAGGGTWHQTAPAGGFHDDVVVVDQEVGDLDFGNVCVGDGGAHTRGFWQNKNGQTLFATNSATALSLLNALNLKNGANQDVTFANYGAFRTWIRSATAKNSAYMLSAQLATMEMNVLFGLVDPTTVILADGATSANAAGFASVDDVMTEANNALAAVPPVRSYQLTLSGILDAANNNLTFAQGSPDDCADPVFAGESFTLYADGSSACSGADDTTQPTGTVGFTPTQDAASFTINLSGLQAGIAYNVVISEDGDCDPIVYNPGGAEFTVPGSGNVTFSGSFAMTDGTYNLLVNVVSTTATTDPKEHEITTVDTNVVVL